MEIYFVLAGIVVSCLVAWTMIARSKQDSKSAPPFVESWSEISVQWYDIGKADFFTKNYIVPPYITVVDPHKIYIGNSGTTAFVQLDHLNIENIIAHHADTVLVVYKDFYVGLVPDRGHPIIDITMNLVEDGHAKWEGSELILIRVPKLVEEKRKRDIAGLVVSLEKTLKAERGKYETN